MLSKENIRALIVRAADDLGCQLRQMRLSRGHRIQTVSQATRVSIDEIDRIENWNIDTLNLESLIKLAAFYDKRLYVDFLPLSNSDVILPNEEEI